MGFANVARLSHSRGGVSPEGVPREKLLLFVGSDMTAVGVKL